MIETVYSRKAELMRREINKLSNRFDTALLNRQKIGDRDELELQAIANELRTIGAPVFSWSDQ